MASRGIRGGSIECQVCGKRGHTVDTCFRIHKCQICGKHGHLTSTCYQNLEYKSQQIFSQNKSLSGTGLSLECQICSKKGHTAAKCVYRTFVPADHPSLIIPTCQICGLKGHTTAKCFYRTDVHVNHPSLLIPTCQICGLKGHVELDCTHRTNFAYQRIEPPATLTALTALLTGSYNGSLQQSQDGYFVTTGNSCDGVSNGESLRSGSSSHFSGAQKQIELTRDHNVSGNEVNEDINQEIVSAADVLIDGGDGLNFEDDGEENNRENDEDINELCSGDNNVGALNDIDVNADAHSVDSGVVSTVNADIDGIDVNSNVVDLSNVVAENESEETNLLQQLSEACLVVDALEVSVREALVNSFCSKELTSYEQIFERAELAKFDKTERRYAWIMHCMRTIEEIWKIFPAIGVSRWRVLVLYNSSVGDSNDDGLSVQLSQLSTALMEDHNSVVVVSIGSDDFIGTEGNNGGTGENGTYGNNDEEYGDYDPRSNSAGSENASDHRYNSDFVDGSHVITCEEVNIHVLNDTMEGVYADFVDSHDSNQVGDSNANGSVDGPSAHDLNAVQFGGLRMVWSSRKLLMTRANNHSMMTGAGDSILTDGGNGADDSNRESGSNGENDASSDGSCGDLANKDSNGVQEQNEVTDGSSDVVSINEQVDNDEQDAESGSSILNNSLDAKDQRRKFDLEQKWAALDRTATAMKEDEELVALHAAEFWSLIAVEFWCSISVEFWSSICDVEVDILEEYGGEFTSDYVISCFYLIPFLLKTLRKHEEDQDQDEGAWNIALTGGTCLRLVARTVSDDVVPLVMPFIEKNISTPDWRQRDAATYAFGSILEGTSPEKLMTLINHTLSFMLNALMKDPNNHVKDTTGWTLGMMFESSFETPIITQANSQLIISVLQSMRDVPNVAEKACGALYFLAQGVEDTATDGLIDGRLIANEINSL